MARQLQGPEADLVSGCAWSRATATFSLRASERPEFDAWRWHEYWIPLETVIEFKREVYAQALNDWRAISIGIPSTANTTPALRSVR